MILQSIHRITLLLLVVPCLAISSQQDVAFEAHDGLLLEGTLYLPNNGDNTWSTAVVLIHGSGPQSRHGYMMGQSNLAFPFTLALFDDIAQALVDDGIAVLTYDKRSCGAFNQCSSNNSYSFPSANTTVHDFLLDAAAAIAYLEEDHNASIIVPVGHSQGGQYIPILLSEELTTRASVPGGIMLAGPFRPIDELLQYQLDFTIDLLEQMGVNVTADEALETIPSVKALVDFVQAVHDIRNGTSNASAGGAPASFYTSWFDLTDDSQRAALRTNGKPMLIINGDADWNVPPEEALAWERHIVSSNNSAVATPTVLILPCVTHAMNCLSESDPAKVNPAEHLTPHVDTRVTQAMVDFVLNMVDSCNSTATVGCSPSNSPASSTTSPGRSMTIAVWLTFATFLAMQVR